MGWNEINNILDALATDRSIISERVPVTNSTNYSAYHQKTNENEHVIQIPLVGIEKNDVTIEVEENVLTVTAKTNSNSTFVRNYKNSWLLSKNSQIDEMTAELKNGLLRIVIPNKKKHNDKKVIQLS